MKKAILTFLAQEDGATVVDMTMLMAALVGLCIAVTTLVTNGMSDLSGELQDTVIAQDAGPAW